MTTGLAAAKSLPSSGLGFRLVAFGKRYANYYATDPPAPAGEAWLEPLPAGRAAALIADLPPTQIVLAYPQVRGHARKGILDSHPALGLHGEPLGTSASLRWSILPLRTADLGLLGSLETNRLITGNYVPFLALVIGARATYLLLWLPLP